jgi:hypothetical protein
MKQLGLASSLAASEETMTANDKLIQPTLTLPTTSPESADLYALGGRFYCLPVKNYSHKLAGMNTHPSEAPMATTKKIDKPNKKVVRDELTFLDVRQAARDGQKVFDKFVITGRLPITK